LLSLSTSRRRRKRSVRCADRARNQATRSDKEVMSPDREFDRLEDELWSARNDIVQLMPNEIAERLMSHYSCETRAQFFAWWRETLRYIVGLAVADPAISYLQERARCPLCRGGTSSAYQEGFTLPEGLLRHLEGHGNTHRCPVTNAAFRLAMSSLREKFDAADKMEKQQTEQRRKTERVYLLDPSGLPKLFDEDSWHLRETRSPEQLAEAEQRLRKFGFETEINGNVVAYTLMHEGWLVLADPRQVGRIDFTVFANPSGKRPSRKNPGRSHFQFRDEWRRDALARFMAALAQAVEKLPKKKEAVS
jgi:hypothetical protein